MAFSPREETKRLIEREAGSLYTYCKFLNTPQQEDQKLIHRWQRSACLALCFISRDDQEKLSQFLPSHYTDILFEKKETLSDFLISNHQDPVLNALKRKALVTYNTIEFGDVLFFAETLIHLNSGQYPNQKPEDAKQARAYMALCLKNPTSPFEKRVGDALRKIEKIYTRTRHLQNLYP